MPTLYIISGCNGAGKTTASFTVLPDILSCREFVNADEIARGLSPFSPETVSVQAGRIMLARIRELLLLGKDLAIETTLTTKSYLKTIQQAKDLGYQVNLLFFWLNHVELANVLKIGFLRVGIILKRMLYVEDIREGWQICMNFVH